MSNEIIGTGKTVQLATQFALKQVSLKDFESYDIQVIQDAKKGFLGFGSKDAKVAVTLKADKARMSEYLISEIGKFLGVQPKFDKEFKEDKNELKMIFNGDDSDKFFEILGRSSKKLEFLLTTMLNKTDRDNYVKARFNHPSLANSNRKKTPRNDQEKSFQKNTEESGSNEGQEREERAPRNNRPQRDNQDRPQRDSQDRPQRDSQDRPQRDSQDRPQRNSQDRPQRDNQDRPQGGNRGPRRDKNFSSGKISTVREDFIRSNAKKMAKKVLDSQEPVSLPPMNSYERRLVHTALKEFDSIVTKSEGDDRDRHIVIEFNA
jgi:spoIIIJ-associated protein